MSRILPLLFVSCLLSASTTVFGQKKFTLKKDLRTEWMVYGEQGYEKIEAHQARGVSSLHLLVNTGQYSRDYLQIESRRPFYIFVDGKLLRMAKGQVSFALDSLGKKSRGTVLMTVYQKKINPDDLKTTVVSTAAAGTVVIEEKPRTFFRDFVTLAGLILMGFFVAMVRLQPKLAADYLSLNKIVSLREGEDNQAHARFALSSNVWFYVFCSLLLALFMMILFYHLPDKFVLTAGFRKHSFAAVWWQWVTLSVTILLILFTKIIVIFGLSRLFGLRGIAGLHFFNAIRLLLTVTSALSIIVFIYYISRGNDDGVYTIFLSVLVFILAAFILLVFLKLSGRREHSMFHLFSYICATEVIPLLVIVKVLFH